MIELAESAGVEEAIHKSQANADMETAVGMILVAAYPGHLWHIESKGEQGIVAITNQELSNGPGARPWGFILHIKTIATASELRKKVIMAAGEILERYAQHRGKMDVEAIDSLPHDFKGLPVGDVS